MTGTTPQEVEARQMALFVHLSSIVLALLGPILIHYLKGKEHPFSAYHGLEGINFGISLLIYYTVAIILTTVTFGIATPLIFAVTVFQLVVAIMAAVKANNGEWYRLPLTIRFLKS